MKLDESRMFAFAASRDDPEKLCAIEANARERGVDIAKVTAFRNTGMP